MSNKEDLALMAHLMRRAGFGANRDELEALAAKGYDAVVDELVDPPEELHGGKGELLLRYYPGCLLPGGNPGDGPGQLALPHGQHRQAPGREDGPFLAPCVRNRQLQAGQLRTRC